MFEDRADVAEADEDGRGGEGRDSIATYEDNKPCGEAQGTVADMTISGDKEDAP